MTSPCTESASVPSMPKTGNKWNYFGRLLCHLFLCRYYRPLQCSVTQETLVCISICSRKFCEHSSWHSDTIWHHVYCSRLVQVYYLVAWWHQSITWTNVVFSLVRSADVHLKAISPDSKALNHSNQLENCLNKFHSTRARARDLTHCDLVTLLIVNKSFGWLVLATIYQIVHSVSWWRHAMETFSVLLALSEWNPPVDSSNKGVSNPGFDVSLEVDLNKRLSKQSSAGDLGRHGGHCDVIVMCTFETEYGLIVLTSNKKVSSKNICLFKEVSIASNIL